MSAILRIHVNSNIEAVIEAAEADTDVSEILLRGGIQKLEELDILAAAEVAGYMPLLLVQALTGVKEDELIYSLKTFFEAKGYSEANENLVVFTSDYKTADVTCSSPTIMGLEGKVRVVIYKQALATGIVPVRKLW